MASAVLAQEPSRPAQQRQPNVKSPEILPDNRVMFRIYAPKASEVSLTGEWIAAGAGNRRQIGKR